MRATEALDGFFAVAGLGAMGLHLHHQFAILCHQMRCLTPQVCLDIGWQGWRPAHIKPQLDRSGHLVDILPARSRMSE